MDGAYVIKLDKYADVWTYWIVLYVKNIEIIYFDSFVVKHVPKEIINLFDIKTKAKKKNIFGIQASNLLLCVYFCIGFIDFMLVGKTLIDYLISLFWPYDFEKNDNMILTYCKNTIPLKQLIYTQI